MRHKSRACVVGRAIDGTMRIRHYPSAESLLKLYSQIGIEDCSTDLRLRGLPVFRDLVGPVPQNSCEARYETPEVFERLTKRWSRAEDRREAFMGRQRYQRLAQRIRARRRQMGELDTPNIQQRAARIADCR